MRNKINCTCGLRAHIYNSLFYLNAFYYDKLREKTDIQYASGLNYEIIYKSFK